MRRDLIPAALAIVLVPATIATMLALIPEPPASTLAFPKPAHRLAVAVETSIRAEVPTVKRGNFSIHQDIQHYKGPGKFVTTDELRLPPDYPGLWLPVAGPSSPPTVLVLKEFNLAGTTRDGRPFQITIRPDSIGEGSLADFHGDAKLARRLAPKIAERLAHPDHPHESDEDRAALMAFFGPKNGGKRMGRMPATLTPVAPVPPPRPMIVEGSPR